MSRKLALVSAATCERGSATTGCEVSRLCWMLHAQECGLCAPKVLAQSLHLDKQAKVSMQG